MGGGSRGSPRLMQKRCRRKICKNKNDYRVKQRIWSLELDFGTSVHNDPERLT